jgi:1,4-alpha-glucan branching enzyme
MAEAIDGETKVAATDEGRGRRSSAVRRKDAVPLAIEALVRGENDDPFALLGPHRDGNRCVLRCFLPQAVRVWAIEADDNAIELKRVHEAGVFEAAFGGRGIDSYRLRAELPTKTIQFEDPYRFPQILGDLDIHLIAEGTHLRLFDVLGAQMTTMLGVSGISFAVWAPNARRVSVVGDFNDWDGRVHPMRRRPEAGLWEIFIPGLGAGALYKYEIKGADGALLPLKSDPIGFRMEHPPGTASIVHLTRDAYVWSDQAWRAQQKARNARSAPISIYECHLGSWARHGDGNRYLSFSELSQRLVPYVKEMGFTHIELMPIAEYPFDGSWGYQPLGLFAPTSRFGTPDDFCGFIDACHAANIGVLVDWVPGHFPSDPSGLAYFDGTHLYEHADARLGLHKDWNTLIYNFGRREVANYLLASALYWLERFHVDGLRVDAVASMLYLDYSRQPGEWIPNIHGGNENLEATAFLRRFNETLYHDHPDTMTVAEESTAWPAVSRPTYVGGLGFGFKWNMGWMHDTLHYMSRDPIHRKWHHHDMTFGALYAFSENFVLPLSHDEVVHGKGSLIGKMPGDRWQRFANLRAYYGFMYAHPGKKLLFMGGEFAQEREWNHDQSLDWHLLDDEMHRGVQTLMRDLNRLYRGLPALHECDCEPDGFEWIEANDSEASIFAFLRRGKDREKVVVVVSNFTPLPREHYRLGVPQAGCYVERINTDSSYYGGSNVGDAAVYAEPVSAHGRPYSITLRVPPLATVLLEWTPA